MINKILRWGGVLFIMIGATFVAFNIQPYSVISLNLGTLLYLIYAYKTKDWALFILNVFLFLIYGIGVYIRI